MEQELDVIESAQAPEQAPANPAHDLNDPSLYLNRELTWLSFNSRVLHEASTLPHFLEQSCA